MATTFNLQDTINGVNNPSVDGIFEYGWWDVTNTVFTRHTNYGYTDGSPTPPTGPYDPAKILGWFTPALGESDFAVAFEHIQGNSNITPQPFPTTGIYVHPTMNPDRRIGVRMNVPANATLSATGTIQAADTSGCGSNIGYNIKNGGTDLIPRTNLPKSGSPTTIGFSSVPVTPASNIDFIIDIGDDGTNFCDDTAIDMTYTILLDKMPTPQLQGTFTCSTTTAIIYNLALQGEGTVEFYRVGTALPLATAPITQVGYNGRATFTGLDLSAGGEFYVIAKNAGQIDSDESTHVTIPSCYSADAVNDNVGTQTTGVAHTVDVSVNDTLCTFGTTTFTFVAGSAVNATGISFTGSTATYTPTADGPFSFQYEIRCNGNILDTATVSGTGCTPPAITAQPTGGAICTDDNITLTVTATGTATLTYQWRESGTPIVGATNASYMATAAGTYSVVVSNGCGTAATSANAVVTVNTPPTIATGGTLPDATSGTAYTHSITLNGTTPFTLSNVVKPAWMTIALTGSTINFTGTPAVGDVATGVTVSFDVDNTCDTLSFSDTINVASGCTNVTTVTVTGNSPVVAGSSQTYNATGVNGTAPYTYNWTITNGTIVSGQGTASVTVNFTATGTINVAVGNCSGAGSANGSLPVTVYTADAVNDNVGTKETGDPTTTDVTTNDVVCNQGTTTYALVAGTGTNVSGLSMTTAGLASYTPVADGVFSFQYNILCDGNVIDTATVSGTAATSCSPVGGGVITGNMNPVSGATETYIVSGLTGTAPFTYNWTVADGIIISGQGTDTIQVQWI